MDTLLNWLGASLPLVSFTLVMSITPGPNNLMLLTSGARFGLYRSLPHLFGVCGGYVILLLVCQAGVGSLMLANEQLRAILTLLSVLYLLWLTWRLLRDGGTNTEHGPQAKPLRWWDAAAFQFVNPKAWGMAIAAVSIASSMMLPAAARLLLLLLVSALINLPCILIWTVFGASLRKYLAIPRVQQLFKLCMGLLLLATAWWMTEPLLKYLF